MAFTDMIRVDELHLGSRISIEDKGKWVEGAVTALLLVGEDHARHRIFLLPDEGDILCFDRTPDTSVILEWSQS